MRYVSKKQHKRKKIDYGVSIFLSKKQSGCCGICHARLPISSIHVDHIIPLSKGGDNSISNLRLVCASCNLQKSNKL